jgi:histone deacetylase HOS3
VVSVLEGGYSDKALTSAAMAHVAGFFPGEEARSAWWQESALSNVSSFNAPRALADKL